MSVHLSARNLTVDFAAPGGGVLRALGPVSFEIPPGQFVTVVGPSGCGKSTLVRIFAGLQPPSDGDALVEAQPLRKPSPRVGMMFQQANLMPWRTIKENIALPLELAGITKAEREQAVEDLIPILGLEGFQAAYPGEISGGMAQRAALGRLLVQRPEALLLDEPFGALDALTREQVSIDLLRIWRETQQTVVMVTHDINEAVFVSDRVLVMSRRPGRIVADITVNVPRPRQPEQVYQPDFVATAQQVRAAIT